MRRVLPQSLLAVFVVGSVLACGGDASKVRIDMRADTPEVEPAGAGDVKITSVDNALVLAVVGDSVVMQLSDSLRQSVQQEITREMGTATKDADQGDFGAQIGAAVAGAVGSAVKGAVGTAMGFRMRVPASEITELRYENGELRFRVKGGGMNFNTDGGAKRNDESTGAFTETDAERFITAVRAAQARSGAAAQH